MAAWSVEDVCAFLEENGLDEYVASFKANKINGKLLRALKRDRLLKMVSHVCAFRVPSGISLMFSSQGMTEFHLDALMDLVAESS